MFLLFAGLYSQSAVRAMQIPAVEAGSYPDRPLGELSPERGGGRHASLHPSVIQHPASSLCDGYFERLWSSAVVAAAAVALNY